MFKVNDYLEIKDLHVPTAYLDEFCEAFNILLDNHAAQLVDVSVLSNFNSEPSLPSMIRQERRWKALDSRSPANG